MHLRPLIGTQANIPTAGSCAAIAVSWNRPAIHQTIEARHYEHLPHD
jgi:hypothetical protein